MEWQRMWVLAWVVSGLLCGWQHGCGAGCVGGGGVWGFEHRRTPTRQPAPACLRACLSVYLNRGTLVVPQAVMLSTTTTTVQSCLSGLTRPGAQPSTRRQLLSRGSRMLHHSRAPSLSERKSKGGRRQVHRTVDRFYGHHLLQENSTMSTNPIQPSSRD